MEEQENSESSNENEQKTLTSPLAEVEMLEDTTFTPILHKESNHFAMPDWAQAPNPEKLVEILPEIYRHLAQFDKTDAGKEDSYKNLNLGDRLRHHAVENAGNPEFSSKFTAFASIYDMTFRLYSSFRENNVDTEHKMNAILNLSGYYNDLYGKDTTAEIAKILAIAEDTPSSPIIHVPQSGNKLQASCIFCYMHILTPLHIECIYRNFCRPKQSCRPIAWRYQRNGC